MPTTLTSKGQVTIPKDIREYLGIKAGAKLDFKIATSGNVVVLPSRPRKRRKPDLSHLVGTLKSGLTTDELMRLTRGDDWPSSVKPR
ncbi:MAG: AbrB/MazE/SpoVT family DNA-binding domain-containing protein [Rhodospirillaceae bacterium]|nr:AbrB/MazE/SpoVT family DNA-binding domain-containing protein [Rhodospirillaceae bacterium]